NNFLIAVSNSSDPTAGWKGFKIDADSTNAVFADYPTLGLNANGVYMASNNFLVGGSGSFQNVDIVSIPKADLLAGSPSVANATVFQRRTALNSGNTVGIGFAPQPVVNFAATASSEPVIGVGQTKTFLLNEHHRTAI